MLKIQFFNDVSDELKNIVNHYYYISGYLDKEDTQILLPMNHVDIIISVKTALKYGKEKREYEMIHFHGIRKKALQVTHSGYIQVYGISFNSFGFYSVVNHPMNKYVNRIVDLSEVNEQLNNSLVNIIMKSNKPATIISYIEKELPKYIDISNEQELDFSILNSFAESGHINIMKYCDYQQISIKNLERLFLKYVGVTPKSFININRLEQAVKDVTNYTFNNLTEVAYNNGYYDQSHFIKSFKNYTSYTPKNFKKNNPSLKSTFIYDEIVLK